MSAATGKKRASPGLDEQKNLFDVELSDADAAKLKTARQEVDVEDLNGGIDPLIIAEIHKQRKLFSGTIFNFLFFDCHKWMHTSRLRYLMKICSWKKCAL